MDFSDLKTRIAEHARALGFQQMGVADLDLSQAEQRLHDWLAAGRHGEMGWMAAHGNKRSRPAELEPDTVRVLSLRMDYLPPDTQPVKVLQQKEKAYVSRYALGRDYHKLVRKRLARLAALIREEVADTRLARAFVDSAPVMEKPLAEKAGLGWQGKHTLILNRHAGSWFFLGEIYTDLPLPVDGPAEDHCGKCSACMTVCPTDAIVAPYQLDARRCISYLTIELKGSIPEEIRPMIGNRIYGCDDCLAACPWNRFAGEGRMMAEHHRLDLGQADLLELLALDGDGFRAKFRGTPMKRTKRRGVLRNVCVALGNVGDAAAIPALERACGDPEPLIAEHAEWALGRVQRRLGLQK